MEGWDVTSLLGTRTLQTHNTQPAARFGLASPRRLRGSAPLCDRAERQTGSQCSVDLVGKLKIKRGDAAHIVRGQSDGDSIEYILPVRVMVHLLCQ